MGVQPQVVVASAPGRGNRVRLVDHERVEPGPADRPGRCQASRARAHDHDVLIHGATIVSDMASVSKGRAAGLRVRPLAAEDLDQADRSRPDAPGYRTSGSFVIEDRRQAWRW